MTLYFQKSSPTFELTSFTSRDLSRLAKQLPQPLNDFTMLTMEPIFEEGKREGKREGKEIGMKIGKEIGMKIGKEIGMKIGKEIYAIQVAFKLLAISPELRDDQIAKIVDLPKEMVAMLRKRLEYKPEDGKSGSQVK